MKDRFSRLLVMNTTLGPGDQPLGEGFLAWRAFSNLSPDMDIAALMRRSIAGLTAQEAEAYAVPFPNARYKAGVRRFPNLVPDNPDADGAALSRKAREFWSNSWTGKSFMAIGMRDPVLGPAVMHRLRQMIRHCPEPMEIPEAGHFTQEAGAAIVEHALRAFAQ
jgi:haloalkane dehalogenase